MNNVIFKTEEGAIFQFDRKSVMECLEHRKSSYEIHELDTLIEVLFNKTEPTILTSAELPRFGFIALDLINVDEGSVVCKNCSKRYRSNQLEGFTVGPDDAFRAASTKKGGFKGLFRKKPKLPGIQGGKGYKCKNGHTLIFMITWRT